MTKRNSYRYSRLAFFSEASIKKLKQLSISSPDICGNITIMVVRNTTINFWTTSPIV